MGNNTINNEQTVIDEYAHIASRYDKRWSFYISATLRETLKRLDIKPTDTLLDVGCGTGTLLEAISQKYPSAKLVGTDISREMLRIAYRKQFKKCSLVESNSRQLPFHSESFDMVVSCNAFHYFRMPEECLSEIARVLKPQGRIVITDWCDDYIACRICDIFLRIFNRAHFKTYGLDACRRMLRDAGYTNIEAEKYKINWLWGLMTARALR
ncbi:MAG: methyltransferase domain-containing protein [Candidatus Loosdrechtia sp.]|uniref:methyltransferase domain-containing protein n=1 Tax=Candidatus Loosdrechtia sp. TaxID=3101272 RepID=UPI003A751ADE|nr:MAG: methyltransferase domain-containing protein [Candidatus Jettenia sp. AMX2]